MVVENGHMVVGVDGSEGSTHALYWAEAHVGQFGSIQPVITWHFPWWSLAPTLPGLPPRSPESGFQSAAEKIAQQTLERIDPDKLLETVTVNGSAGPTLVEIGEEASLIVVGTRGRNKLAAGLLGSVSLHCVNHAKVPVAVVPDNAPLDDYFERVVIGIDGSENSVEALKWAFKNTSDASVLEVVHVWNPESIVVAEVWALAENKFSDLAGELATETVDKAKEQAAQPDRQVEIRVEQGDPRNILKAASQRADLLVVGAHGGRHVEHLMIGSVASALINHPEVTTIVVPELQRS